jgi:hypothetical protein
MICVALVRPSAPPQDVSCADLIVEDLGSLDVDALNALPSDTCISQKIYLRNPGSFMMICEICGLSYLLFGRVK